MRISHAWPVLCLLLLQDKQYCATINVVLRGYTVSNALAGFPAQITLPFSVCWYKHNGQAKATFDFGSCGAGIGESCTAVRPYALVFERNTTRLRTCSLRLCALSGHQTHDTRQKQRRTLEAVPNLLHVAAAALVQATLSTSVRSHPSRATSLKAALTSWTRKATPTCLYSPSSRWAGQAGLRQTHSKTQVAGIPFGFASGTVAATPIAVSP